jgi:hypothetical protein
VNFLPSVAGSKNPQCFEGCSGASVSALRGTRPESAFSEAVFSGERHFADLLTLDNLLISKRDIFEVALTFASFVGYREGLASNSGAAAAVTV